MKELLSESHTETEDSSVICHDVYFGLLGHIVHLRLYWFYSNHLCLPVLSQKA